MASLEKIYSILGFVLAADKFTLSIYFLTFQLLFHWIHLVMFFHLVIFNTLQGRHHLEMWRGRCGGWEFFLQVFFGHNPIMQDIFRCWIFFPVSFAIQDFLFCRIFPFYLFFLSSPLPFKCTLNFWWRWTDLSHGGRGGTPTKQGGGVWAIFYTTGIFLGHEICHVFLGVLRENIFLGGLHICQGKIIYSNILSNVWAPEKRW